MNRLNDSSLGELPASVAKPAYDRHALKAGIVHLGLGAFHRAHQAVYTDQAIEHSGGDWGIIGVSMRSGTVASQLHPQDGLYSVLSQDQHDQSLRVIGAIKDVLVAPQAPRALYSLLADPAIRVVTLTITEKGYCLGQDGWSLDHQSAQVQQDLASPETPVTAVGVLARGLAMRYHRGGAPITLLSCDNLGENSTRLRAVLTQYLETTSPETVPWLESEVAFPCTMVDRIVPAMTDAGLDSQSALLGLRDEGAVATEPFTQWIIEDRFATDVPDWAAAGAQLVADIQPFEEIKLRLLNASHSAIAISGLLAGKETVADVMADPQLAERIVNLMSEELIPALQAPAGFDLPGYRDQLLERFANPHLRHRCAQIAADSTEKIRQRWLVTLGEQRGETELLRALASWCYLVLNTDLAIDDPRADSLLALRCGKEPFSIRLESTLECVGIKPGSTHLSLDRLRMIADYCRIQEFHPHGSASITKR